MASDLDRVDHHRSSVDWVGGLWRSEDAKLLKLDANSRFTTNTGGSKLRMTRPFVEFDSQRHRLLGLLNGSPIFAVETLTEGEVHDLREVGFQLSDNERDIAAAATALVNWHQLEPMCPQCGGPTKVINGGFARHCDGLRDRPLPAYRPGRHRRGRRRVGPAAARWPADVGQPGLGAGRLRRDGGVAGAGHPPRDR